ncbi:uncharacterized protein LOC115268207 [Aedes albopictus]|uniref:CCHC-type domain-containing protein n=1 Tax=Aedes albopictus TaxID=7160 RepID=A0ABM1XMB2_AEDAL|nr:uncharacterized protein LOC115268207 [Aedes albopictus]
MNLWLKFLIYLRLLGIACSHQVRGSIVCYLRLRSDLDESLQSQLRKCSYVVVCDDFCERRKPFQPYTGDKLSQLKQMAPHAKLLLSIPLSVNPFELRVDEGSEQLCHEIEHCVRDDLYDGVDLDFNAFVLDFADQIIFSQFLERLRQRLKSKIIISLSLDVQRFTTGPLANSIIQYADFVVTSRDDSFTDGNQDDGEFLIRQYSDAAIDRLVAGGFPPEKIVLGLQTAGIVTNPSERHEFPLKRCAIIGLIPYSQVCELRDQSKSFCSWNSDRRCLLFDGQSKLIYDNKDAAKQRAHQCIKHGLKGVSILLHYDDSTGLCGDKKYPLLNAVDEILSAQHDDEHSREEKSKTNIVNHHNSHSLNDEINRLESAIEHLEKSSNLFEKIANLLLRALYKLVDVVISFMNTKTGDGSSSARDVPEPIPEPKNPTVDEGNGDGFNPGTNNDSFELIDKEVDKIAEEHHIADTGTSEIKKHEETDAVHSLMDTLEDFNRLWVQSTVFCERSDEFIDRKALAVEVFQKQTRSSEEQRLCYACGSANHVMRNCELLKKVRNESSRVPVKPKMRSAVAIEEEVFHGSVCFAAFKEETHGGWYLDSGASSLLNDTTRMEKQNVILANVRDASDDDHRATTSTISADSGNNFPEFMQKLSHTK